MSRIPVVVCGANHGATYVAALRATDRFELVGILGRGSERSRAIARDHGVPLFATVAEIPSSVRHACVAAGDDGVAVARALVTRGVHVLLEHPTREDPLRALLDDAARAVAVVHVNAHFPLLSAQRDFCARVRARSRPLHLALSSGVRLVYATLDLVARALGPAELVIDAVARPRHGLAATGPFGALGLVGQWGDVHTSLSVSALASPVDDGSDAGFGQRVFAHFERGSVCLVDRYGPVVASGPAALVPGAPPESIFAARVSANARALAALVDHAGGAPCPDGQEREHLLTTSRNWERVRTFLRERCGRDDRAERDGRM